MKYIYKHIIHSVLVLFAVALPLALVGSNAVAAPSSTNTDSVCTGVNIASGSTGASCDTPEATDSVNSLIATIINVFSWVVGVIAVIMLIYGGFRFVTSTGDSANLTAARQTIIYALIGLVIVALAQVIVQFVLGQFIF